MVNSPTIQLTHSGNRHKVLWAFTSCASNICCCRRSSADLTTTVPLDRLHFRRVVSLGKLACRRVDLLPYSSHSTTPTPTSSPTSSRGSLRECRRVVQPINDRYKLICMSSFSDILIRSARRHPHLLSFYTYKYSCTRRKHSSAW